MSNAPYPTLELETEPEHRLITLQRFTRTGSNHGPDRTRACETAQSDTDRGGDRAFKQVLAGRMIFLWASSTAHGQPLFSGAGLGNLTQIKQGAHTHPAQRGGTIPDEEKCTHSHTHTQHCAMMQSIHERSDDAQCFCLLMMRRECTHCCRQHLSFPLGVRGGGVHIWLRIFWEFAAQVPMCVRDCRG